jgi:two-component system, chemotaxis family, sensor histidine kinase and response regulator PixL
MYIDPKLRDRVYQLFSLEVPKMLQTIETELVTLEIDRSEAKVNSLLRAAHSIKGSAASLGLKAIRDLAHQLEDIFRVLSHPELTFDRELELLLLSSFDCLNKLVTAEINGETLPSGFEVKTQIVFADLDEHIGHFVIAGQRFTNTNFDDIDRIRSIFEIDVAQSLIRLERVLMDPESSQIAIGEFRAQAEVFTGIAALTNLPGFGAISHTFLAALDLYHGRAREICLLAFADFHTALATILNGDLAAYSVICAEGDITVTPLKLQLNEILNWTAGDLINPEDSFDDQSAFAVFLPPIVELMEEDFLIEDILCVPAIDQFLIHRNYQYDLEDIFELATESSQSSNLLEVSHNYDLEDIFDQPHSLRMLPQPDHRTPVLAGLSTSYDLEDIFDLPDLFTQLERGELGLLVPRLPSLPILDLEDIFDLPSFIDPAIARDRSPTKLEQMIADITSKFDQLAPITPTTFTTPKIIKPARVKKSRKVMATAASQLSVRVTLDRLERMNNLMGELAIDRNGLDLSNEQCVDLLQQLRLKCANFHKISDKLQQIADTLAISAQHQPARGDKAALAAGQDLQIVPAQIAQSEFDILELDRYSEVHHIAQATSEQLAQIEEQIEDLALFTTQSHHQIDRQKQHIAHLRDDLMWARMLPLGEILNRFPRTLHDLSIEFNKPVDLKITGAGVLVDRAVIDKLLDPLVHLLRNAFDHGIDFPEARQAIGKSDRGLIEITAYHQGSQTVIEITDDGRGIDPDKIRAKAISLALLTHTEAVNATRAQLLDLLFTPGFSTADRVTKLSGRGMGLDIVKEQIQSTKGTISIDSEVGRGTTFTLRIPLTLTIAQLMVCQVGAAIYAFPADSIQKIVVPTPAQLTQQDNQQVFQWQNLSIPIYKLADLLTYSIPVPIRTISQTLKSSADNPADWLPPLLLIRKGNRMIALEIDQLITEQELTIKPFGKAIAAPSYSYGCTILGDGVVLPVLDPHALIQVLVEQPLQTMIPAAAIPTISNKSILVVDDSITTRQSLCLSLEKFGYITFQAKDGQEALQILRQKASEIKLVVCDVEMPNMNGFEFLNVYRQDQAISHIPVVMLTSRSNAKHRQFAAHLGAVDYFIKPYIEQDFMTAIAKIIVNK